MDRRRLIIGYLLALGGAALFSSKTIFVKLAYMENPDAILILTWRMIFALPFFAAVGAYAWVMARRAGRRTPGAGTILRVAMIGFIGYYLAMILDFEGLVHVSAQLERLALFTYPIFLIFIGAAFFGAKITRGHLIAAFTSYTGLALVFLADFSHGGSNVPLGTALVLGSAICFAVYQLMAKDMIGLIGSVLFTAIALSAASIAGLVHFFMLRDASYLAVSPRYFALAAGTGLFATVIPSFAINAGMARIGAQSTAMISTISPLLTIGFAVALLDEPFTLADALGTALVMGGVGYNTWLDFREIAPAVTDASS